MEEKIKEVQETKNILFWHVQFPKNTIGTTAFSRNSAIHKYTEKIAKRELNWTFIGGYIDDERTDFWEIIEKIHILFCLPINMDYNDAHMLHDEAEKKMLIILEKIKKINPSIKIFFINQDNDAAAELLNYGEFITELHGDPAVINYFQNIK